MKPFYSIITFLFFFNCAFTQQLSQVTYTYQTSFAWFSILTDQNVLIRISENGKPLEWGTEEQSLFNNNYYAPKLLPYMGRIDYYGPETDSAYRGKVKSIGTCPITYYGSGEYPIKIGKIKSAGRLMFDYYTNFDDKLLTGKIKNIGNNTVAWYTSFDNEAFKGKLKTVGNTSLTYYASFDDTMIKGKIKSIGSFNYTWYTSFDPKGYGGALKSGAQRQLINTITYILW